MSVVVHDWKPTGEGGFGGPKGGKGGKRTRPDPVKTGPQPASAGARPGGDRIMDNVVARPPGVIARHGRPRTGGNSQGLLGRMADATSTSPSTLDRSTLPEAATADIAGLPGVRKTDFGALPGVRKTDFDALPGVRRTDFGSLPGVQIDPRDYTNLEAELGNRQQGYQGLLGDLQGLRDERGRIADRFALSGPDDFGSEREAVSNAMYERAMNLRRADDERAQADLENRLWQKGLAPGSEAYDEELNRLQQGRDRAMNDLSLASVMAGAQEHQRLADLTSRNRAQEFGEAAGIFDRGGQTFDRGQQVFDSQSVMQNFQDQAQRDKFDQTFNLRGLLGQEGQQRFSQDMGLRGLLGQEGQQRFGEDMGFRQQLQGEGRDRFDQDMGFRGQRAQEEQHKAQGVAAAGLGGADSAAGVQPGNDLAAGAVRPGLPACRTARNAKLRRSAVFRAGHRGHDRLELRGKGERGGAEDGRTARPCRIARRRVAVRPSHEGERQGGRQARQRASGPRLQLQGPAGNPDRPDGR